MDRRGTGVSRAPCRAVLGARPRRFSSANGAALSWSRVHGRPAARRLLCRRVSGDQTLEYTKYRNSANTRTNHSAKRSATIRAVLSASSVPDLLHESQLRRLFLLLPGCQRLYGATHPAYNGSPSASATNSATSEGFVAARMPAAPSASLLASAVLSPPETIAPAWPIVLPSGAVKPAM